MRNTTTHDHRVRVTILCALALSSSTLFGAIDRSKIIWSHGRTNGIFRVVLDGGNLADIHVSKDGRIVGVVAAGKARPPSPTPFERTVMDAQSDAPPESHDVPPPKSRAVKPPTQKSYLKWTASVTRSPMDDSPIIIFFLDGNELCGRHFERDPPTLKIRYKEGELNAYVSYPMFIDASKKSYSVEYRIGEGEPETQEWGMSTDNKAVFAPDPESFVKRIGKAETLVVRLTPWDMSPVTTTFDIKGFSVIARGLLDAL